MLQLFFLYLFLLVYCLFIICLDIFLCMTRLDLSKNSKIFFMSWNEKVLSNVCVFIFIRSPSPLVTERIHSPFQPKQSPSLALRTNFHGQCHYSHWSKVLVFCLPCIQHIFSQWIGFLCWTLTSCASVFKSIIARISISITICSHLIKQFIFTLTLTFTSSLHPSSVENTSFFRSSCNTSAILFVRSVNVARDGANSTRSTTFVTLFGSMRNTSG